MNVIPLLAAAAAAAGHGPLSTTIDNPWLPLRPGTRTVSIEHENGQRHRVVDTVTHRTKVMASGVVARVVTDVVSHRGVPLEVTEDYFGQDRRGNVWYVGEHTTEYHHGRPGSTQGSFEDGLHGARAGIIMPAHPRVGMAYKQEDFPGHAEDRAKVIDRGLQVQTPLRHFHHVLMTRETDPLEPDALEFKFYARGVGEVETLEVSGDIGGEKLVRLRRP